MLTYDEDTAFSLADDAATVSALARRAGDARLRATKFGDWTAVEVVSHLADAAEIFAERIRRCLEEDEPQLASYDPDALMAERRLTEQDAMDLCPRLQRAHQNIVQAMQDPDARERVAIHSDWGRVTAAHLAAYQARHSHEHVAELAREFPPA